MPLLKLQTSVAVPEARKDSLLKACSKIVAEATGKPEAYVMVMLDAGAGCLNGKAEPVAVADVRGIGGLKKEVNQRLTAALCDLLLKELKIAPDHVYATFTDVPASNWGWNKTTFG